MNVLEFSKEYKISSRTLYWYLKNEKLDRLIEKGYIEKRKAEIRTFWYIKQPHALFLFLEKNTEMFKNK